MAKVRKNKYPIDDKTYKTILQYSVVPCVDLVVVHKGKFLMGFRTNKPAQNQWWMPGGRIWKNETIVRAVQRKAKDEIGIPVRIVKFLSNMETIFKNSAIPGVASHTINSVFLVKPLGTPKPDEQHSQFRWFSKIDPKWHPYVRTNLRLAGFK